MLRASHLPCIWRLVSQECHQIMLKVAKWRLLYHTNPTAGIRSTMLPFPGAAVVLERS